MMKALSLVSSRFVPVLALGALVALVGCTAAGVPVGAVPGGQSVANQPAGTTSPGNSVPPMPPAGSNSNASNPNANNSNANNPNQGPVTPPGPYLPYPMPQPNMPAGIIGYLPAEGAQVCPTPRISLSMRLTDAMRKAGAFDPSTVTLTFDGKDILSQIQTIVPMIFPQNQVTFTYVPSGPLAMGPHQVKLTYVSPSGPLTLTLNFTVADIPCQ